MIEWTEGKLCGLLTRKAIHFLSTFYVYMRKWVNIVEKVLRLNSTQSSCYRHHYTWDYWRIEMSQKYQKMQINYYWLKLLDVINAKREKIIQINSELISTNNCTKLNQESQSSKIFTVNEWVFIWIWVVRLFVFIVNLISRFVLVSTMSILINDRSTIEIIFHSSLWYLIYVEAFKEESGNKNKTNWQIFWQLLSQMTSILQFVSNKIKQITDFFTRNFFRWSQMIENLLVTFISNFKLPLTAIS